MHFHVGNLEQPLGQDRIGGQPVPAHQQVHLGRVLGERQRGLGRRIASADHRHLLAGVGKRVASGAVVHPGADVLRLPGHPHAPVGAAGGDDQGEAAVFSPVGGHHGVIAAQAVDLDHFGGLDHFDVGPPGLFAQAVAEFESADRFREAGHVLDLARDVGVAADELALDYQGVGTVLGGKYRGGQAGRPAADDDQRPVAALAADLDRQRVGQLGVAGAEKGPAVLDQDGREDRASVAQFFEFGRLGRLLDQIDPAVPDSVLAQELAAPAAVGAPPDPVNGDFGVGHVGFPARWRGSRTMACPGPADAQFLRT